MHHNIDQHNMKGSQRFVPPQMEHFAAHINDIRQRATQSVWLGTSSHFLTNGRGIPRVGLIFGALGVPERALRSSTPLKVLYLLYGADLQRRNTHSRADCFIDEQRFREPNTFTPLRHSGPCGFFIFYGGRSREDWFWGGSGAAAGGWMYGGIA